DVSINVIQETQRYLGYDLPNKTLQKDEFNNLLQKNYTETDRSEKSQISDQALNDDRVNFDELSSILEEPDDLLNSDDDAPIIKLLNAILFEAIREKVSDIHIEPYSKELVIRFRLDGVLKSSLTSQVKIAPFLVTRIKVLARLDIAEKRVPQDGRLSVKLGGKEVDLRVSTMPSVYGERVVLRLLDKEDTSLDLVKLGMNEDNIQKIETLINKPHGIILVTGPTGSGKTTTLYACLRKLDRSSQNIMTIEDPIEYYFDGISQTQVNTKANMSFARGLRAILRQDPDVVLVGEIRDTETAKISVQASLTGHLVLSTLHTNTAIGAITRLRDMDIEPFLLASTVQAVMSQRLIRRLCNNCKKGYKPTSYEKKLLKLKPSEKLYKAVGCAKCYDTGYSKRKAVYEIILIDDKLREMINTNKNESEMADYAHKNSISIVESGYDMARAGDTDLAEVIRVVQE
ncbi:MAG: Flp pilus assembly complex ATPase component TadA, partial [Candidatus Portiera sp.]|nr:Flp pilus assembly complex ATPase component TadA [Portiera sp.]